MLYSLLCGAVLAEVRNYAFYAKIFKILLTPPLKFFQHFNMPKKHIIPPQLPNPFKGTQAETVLKSFEFHKQPKLS